MGMTHEGVADTTLQAGSESPGAVRRETLVRWLTGPLGGAAALSAAGGVAASVALGRSAPALTHRDRQIVEFLARLELLEASFYAAALRAGKLTGEARQFAEVAARQERAHLHDLSDLLGGRVPTAGGHRFSHVLESSASFIGAAVKIEDTVLAAYNGQAENMSRRTLGRIARIMSVESRHAAWARGLAGKLPAPVAADVAVDASAAMKALRPFVG